MSELNIFHGPNAGYAEELYDRYRQDPNAVDAATRAFFATYAQSLLPHARNGKGTTNGNREQQEKLNPQPPKRPD